MEKNTGKFYKEKTEREIAAFNHKMTQSMVIKAHGTVGK